MVKYSYFSISYWHFASPTAHADANHFCADKNLHKYAVRRTPYVVDYAGMQSRRPRRSNDEEQTKLTHALTVIRSSVHFARVFSRERIVGIIR